MPYYANTVTESPTHFPAALAMIQEARERFKVPSENWPRPTDIRFGMPRDRYYAEVWTDGMDWQPSYWAIESANSSKPACYPFIIFENHKDRERFLDFKEFCRACLFFRRDILWTRQDPRGHYNDTVWSWFRVCEPLEFGTCEDMIKCSAKHASQSEVKFLANLEFLAKLDRTVLPLLIHKVWSHPEFKDRFTMMLKEKAAPRHPELKLPYTMIGGKSSDEPDKG